MTAARTENCCGLFVGCYVVAYQFRIIAKIEFMPQSPISRHYCMSNNDKTCPMFLYFSVYIALANVHVACWMRMRHVDSNAHGALDGGSPMTMIPVTILKLSYQFSYSQMSPVDFNKWRYLLSFSNKSPVCFKSIHRQLNFKKACVALSNLRVKGPIRGDIKGGKPWAWT